MNTQKQTDLKTNTTFNKSIVRQHWGRKHGYSLVCLCQHAPVFKLARIGVLLLCDGACERAFSFNYLPSNPRVSNTAVDFNTLVISLRRPITLACIVQEWSCISDSRCPTPPNTAVRHGNRKKQSRWLFATEFSRFTYHMASSASLFRYTESPSWPKNKKVMPLWQTTSWYWKTTELSNLILFSPKCLITPPLFTDIFIDFHYFPLIMHCGITIVCGHSDIS